MNGRGMQTLFAVVAALSAAVIALTAWAFAPWTGNFLGSAAALGVPLWIGLAALALGQAAVAVHLVRLAAGRD